MKKTISAMAMFALLFASFNLSAEDEEDRRRRRGKAKIGVHLNFAPMLNGIYSINTEGGLNKNFSVVLTTAYTHIPFSTTVNTMVQQTSIHHYTGFAISPEVRYYFKPSRKPGLDGWFIGAYSKVRKASTDDDALVRFADTPDLPNLNYELERYGTSIFGVAAGLTTGYLYAHKSGFSISTWIGFGYFFINESSYAISPFFNLDELLVIDVRTGLSVGYRF